MKLFDAMNIFRVCVCLFVAANAKEKQKYEVTLYNEENETQTKLYWSVDYIKSRVDFSLQTFKKISFPFIEGLGMSDRGDVTNADILMILCDEDDVSILDSWTDNTGFIHKDKIQNYHFTKYDVTGYQITIEFWRYFNTDDANNYQLDNGTTHLIYFTMEPDYKDELDKRINAFDMKHKTTMVQILRPNIPESYFGDEKEEDVSSFSILQHNVLVPEEETTYWCSVHKIPDDITEKIHGIGYEATIAATSQNIIHHMEVFMCDDRDAVVTNYSGICKVSDKPADVKRCNRVMAAWAKGASTFYYPKEAGMPFGEKGKSRYFRLEVHYNNPKKIAGLVDNSGITFYYTKKLRQFDAGILEIGLTYSGTMAIPPRQEEFILAGHCPSQCTKKGLQVDGINIFASQLHSHLAGRKMWISHHRGSKTLPELNRDNHYSTFFEEIRQLYPPVKVLPDDSLVTYCSYDTSDRTTVTIDGDGILDEMCVSYLHYYPLSELEVCKSSASLPTLYSFFTLEQILNGVPPKLRSENIGLNYLNVEWNKETTDLLIATYEYAPQDIMCKKHNGVSFSGNWKNLS